MNCPLCKVPLERIDICGILIDECDNCHGLWFDNRELERLDEISEGEGEEIDRILSYERQLEMRSEKLTCPRCSIKMQRRNYYHSSGINIDECYGCGGVWLDAGELAAVRENFRNEAEREAIFEQMIVNEPGYRELMAKKAETERKTEVLRQKGLMKNLFKLSFFG